MDSKIELDIIGIDIEYHWNCSYDFIQGAVTLHHRTSKDCNCVLILVLDSDGSEILKSCGEKVLIPPIISNGNKMTVVFFSDSSITSKGIEAKWTKIFIDGSVISSPNYPLPYYNLANKVIIKVAFATEKGQNLKLHIADLEAGSCARRSENQSPVSSI